MCYFPPKGSKFAKGEAQEEADRSDEDSGDEMEEDRDDEAEGPSTQSPYSVLSESIMEYSRLGEVLLPGDLMPGHGVDSVTHMTLTTQR